MSDTTQPVPAFESKKLIGGLIIGLLLAETGLALIASLVRDVIFPLMAMAMGTDPNSPLSLGPATFNWPNLLSAIMQLCLAAIVAILVNSWMQRRPSSVRGRPLSLSQATTQPAMRVQPEPTTQPAPAPQTTQRPPAQSVTYAPAPVPQPVAAPPQPVRTTPAPQPPPIVASTPVAPMVAAPAAAAVAPAVQLAPKPVAPMPASPASVKPAPVPAPPPAKPKKAKRVYYNIVGEPIEEDDD